MGFHFGAGIFMSESKQDILVAEALLGNRDAIALFDLLANASQKIDDFWDGDKPVGREDLASIFFALAVDLPQNRFYRLMQDAMVQIIEDALCQWIQSNDIEATAGAPEAASSAERMLQVSYIRRSSTTDLLIKMARLVGGRDHERAVACRVLSHVYLDNEPFYDYLEEHIRGM